MGWAGLVGEWLAGGWCWEVVMWWWVGEGVSGGESGGGILV